MIEIIPGISPNAESAYAEREAKRAARLAALPRIRFFHDREWATHHDGYEVGVMWGKNMNAAEGELIYRRKLSLHYCFRFKFDWRWS
jgi:hypothetical protein